MFSIQYRDMFATNNASTAEASVLLGLDPSAVRYTYQEMVHCTGSNSSKQKPFVVCRAEGIVPRVADDEL